MAVPALPDPTDPAWGLRASHQERDQVVTLLGDQLSAGRLDLAEFEERTESAMAARTRVDLATLVADLPVRWQPEGVGRAAIGRQRPRPDRDDRRGPVDKGGRSYIAVWLSLMVLWWGIWAAVSLGTGELQFPWPIFPSLGMGIPVLIRFFRRILGVDDD